MRHPFPMDLSITASRPPGRSAREHLREQLRDALLAGQLSAGDPLPATRVLAAAAGVSRGTVVAVYEDLIGEGYAVAVPGSGTYVSEGLASPGETEAGDGRRASARDPARPASDAAGGGASGRIGAPNAGAETIDLVPGAPAAGLRENRDWAAAWRRALRQAPPGDAPPAAGEAELRELLAQHVRSSRGVRCEAADIVVTAGTSDGIGLLLHGLRGVGGRTRDPDRGARDANGEPAIRIATEDPGYPSAREVIVACGGEAVPVAVRDGGMDPGALRRTRGPLAAALLTPSHQYPLGGRLPVSARLDLLAWARDADALIFEDDYDSEFRHGAPPLPAIASLDREERVVLIGSTSKTLTPWLRCGYLVIADAALRERVVRAREALGQPVSGYVQAALAEFLRSGGMRRHLARMGRVYAHRRRLVIEAAARLGPRFRLGAIEGGLHAAITWEGAPDPEHSVARLAERGVALTSLREYSHPGSAERLPNGLVFGYAAPSDLQLSRALGEIVATLSGA
ncbi:PLP-dependent aminotransferase family protein [Leucobacter massiliensis]|uniref:MocR-like pyridoxine biosynthesis transcription factor PdxR n=1 Tax=Leucobacter massiliensis TaxID=1686285 RepID=UPI0011B295E8|nr:PLP-dependent aminotransferase family protein [Leucobacter massiliensis]